MMEEPEDRLVIAEEYGDDRREQYVEDRREQYGGDRETLLHIPDRDYYDDSFEDSESEYYPPGRYSPDMSKPLALVTRKRYEETEDQPWRPW